MISPSPPHRSRLLRRPSFDRTQLLDNSLLSWSDFCQITKQPLLQVAA